MRRSKITLIVLGLLVTLMVLNLSGHFAKSVNKPEELSNPKNALKTVVNFEKFANNAEEPDFQDFKPADDGEQLPNSYISEIPRRKRKSKEIFQGTTESINENDGQITAEAVTLPPLEKELIRKEMLERIQENLSILGVKQSKKSFNVIVTTFRTGSTFLGEAVQSLPGTFYHFEPLIYIGSTEARDERADDGLSIVKNLLECNYAGNEALDEYVISSGDPKYHWVLEKVPELKSSFHTHSWLRTDTDFLSRACKLFPNQLLKTVRLPLHLAEELLKENELDIKILYLVRDPRGTINSRVSLSWCSSSCRDPNQLCQDLENGFQIAQDLLEKYPYKFTIARYEDIALHPVEQMMKIFEFFELPYHPAVAEFVKSHTEFNSGGAHQTHRDSRKNAFKWMDYFRNNTQELASLQGGCHKAMKLWRYQLFNPFTDFEDFNALLPLQNII